MNGDIEHQNLNGNSIKERGLQMKMKIPISQVLVADIQNLNLKIKVAFPTWWLKDPKGKMASQTESLWGF